MRYIEVNEQNVHEFKMGIFIEKPSDKNTVEVPEVGFVSFAMVYDLSTKTFNYPPMTKDEALSYLESTDHQFTADKYQNLDAEKRGHLAVLRERAREVIRAQ